jgi:hypothetical protein
VSSTKEDLTREGLAVTQLCEDEGAVTTMLIHTSGEFISSKLTLKPVKDDPQGRGSCLTYSRRYAYAAILGLVSDDDDDANHASAPAKVSNPKIGEAGGAPSMRVYVDDLAKKKFKSPDLFKAWRVDNGLQESLTGLSELELTIIWNKLKTVKDI